MLYADIRVKSVSVEWVKQMYEMVKDRRSVVVVREIGRRFVANCLNHRSWIANLPIRQYSGLLN